MHANVCIIVCPKCIGAEYLHPLFIAHEVNGGIMAIHDYYSRWRWFSNTLCDCNINSRVFYLQSVMEFPLQYHVYSCICVLMFSWHWCEFQHCFVSITKLGPRLRLRTLWEQRFAWGKTKASLILIMPITIDIIEMRTHMKQSWGGPIFGNAHK